MGALIQTKGTRRLCKHFGNVFGNTRTFGNSHRDVLYDLGGPPVNAGDPPSPLLNSNVYLYDLSQKYSGLLYPPDDPNHHANLLKRWKFYLQYELQSRWHHAIRKNILKALLDNSYRRIIFDTLEGSDQIVLASDECQSSNINDDDNDITTKYMRILLVTPLTSAPDPLGPQQQG